MIKVERIVIDEFRGVRKLTLDLNEKNFAVSGPNGSGKSGVVDAIEFALTGVVSRLTGKGRGDLSLAKHGPHVDKKDDPEKAKVKLTFRYLPTGKIHTIERSVKAPNSPILLPADATVEESIAQLRGRSDFVLSRREVIKYVLVAPNERAKEVETLLRLDDVETARAALSRIAKNKKSKYEDAVREVTKSEDSLKQQLKVDGLTASAMLEAVNLRRTEISLPPLAALDKETSLAAGVIAGAATKQKIQRAQALEDIEIAQSMLGELVIGSKTTKAGNKCKADLESLQKQAAVAGSVERLSLYKSGLPLVTDDACPLCDVAWEQEELRGHIENKIGKLAGVSKAREGLAKSLAEFLQSIDAVCTAVQVVQNHSLKMSPPNDISAPSAFLEKRQAVIASLRSPTNLDQVAAKIDLAIAADPTIGEWLNSVKEKVSALPDLSKQEAALAWLMESQVRLVEYRDKLRTRAEAKTKAEVSQTIAAEYIAASNKVLTNLYSKVEGEFARYYAFINREDESQFTAKLTPTAGSLALEVEFYGRGRFPPAAFHSEGHQDGMGLCLYLALMKHLLGDGFTFAVLDDVLMSVDSGHRRGVCDLLAKEFPKTQFVFTTHDAVWLGQMRTAGLIGKSAAAEFKNWSVDVGPKLWVGVDVWSEIHSDLDSGNIPKAATTLRNFLEFQMKELCELLRAQIEYRADHQYTLGQTLPAAHSALKTLYGKAKASANSYDDQARVAEIVGRANKLAGAYEKTQAEKWPINASIHYNEWANFVKNDFVPVVAAMRELVEEMCCEKCGAYLQVMPRYDQKKLLHCNCYKLSFNLESK